MSLYKRKKIFWCTFSVHGTRYRISTKQTSEKLAKLFESRKIVEAEQNHGLRPRKSVRLIDFIPHFKAWNDERHKANSLGKRTVRYYKYGCQLLEGTQLAKMTLDRITNEEVAATTFAFATDPDTESEPEAAAEDPGEDDGEPIEFSASYRNQAIRTLHRILSYAVAKQYLHAAPVLSLAEEVGRDVTISPEMEEKLLAAMSAPLRGRHFAPNVVLLDVFLMVIDCGMRPDEVFRTRIENIDWNTQTIRISKGKSRAARRRLPMSDRLVDALFVRCGDRKEGWLFPSKKAKCGHITTVAKQFRAASNAAGLPDDLVLYCGRHTFGTDIYSATGNLSLIMKSMGHTSARIAMRYQHPELNQIKAVIDRRNGARTTEARPQ